MTKAIREKLKEAFFSVFPIALTVLIISVVLTPLPVGAILLFCLGTGLLIVGSALFTLGADASMLAIGQKVGSTLTKTKKVWLIAFVSFVIGVIVTVAEPDLQILAEQVGRSVEGIGEILVWAVGVGVGLFLTVAMLRILFGVSFKIILAVLYPVLFVVAIVFVDPSFWAVAFDSGGVTTGPVTVPFILSLGAGVATVRSSKKGESDSFGLVALSSVGPILAVLILGIVCSLRAGDYTVAEFSVPDTSRNTFFYLVGKEGILRYALEVGKAMSPIVIFFVLFEICSRAFHRRQLIKVIVGLVYSYVGLTLFLTGANVGFLPVGSEIGNLLAQKLDGWLLLPVGMVLGYFVVSAEPAVYVLNRQVERMSAGAVTAKTMKRGLCVGVCLALGFSMLRLVVGFSVMWLLIPGYACALLLMPFTPEMFTGIAFDSGGVASGAMVSSFILPMAIGACGVLAEEEIMTLAYGCVSLVALAPLISIQVLGIVYKRKKATYRRHFKTQKDDIVEYEVD